MEAPDRCKPTVAPWPAGIFAGVMKHSFRGGVMNESTESSTQTDDLLAMEADKLARYRAAPLGVQRYRVVVSASPSR